MDVVGNRVDLLFGICYFCFVGIYVVFLIKENQDQKFNELLMDDQITHGVILLRQLINVVELIVQSFLEF